MSYGTLDKSLLSSSLLDHGPIPVAVWTLILAEKDKYDVTTLNPRTVAKLLRMPLEDAEAAWEVLTSIDLESSNKQENGKRLIPYGEGKWLVVSHAKYAKEHSLARKRERDAEAQQKHRDRAKAEERCAQCGGTPVLGAVGGHLLCEKHWAEEAPPGDDEGVV